MSRAAATISGSMRRIIMETLEKQEQRQEHHHSHHHSRHHSRHHSKHHSHHDHDDRDCKERRRHHQSHHVRELEMTIEALADALAHLGRGGHLHELLRLIRMPGWNTSAEFAFVNAILDHISVEVRTLDRMQADLVEASRKVTHKPKERHCP
jgi:hypothetical protein